MPTRYFLAALLIAADTGFGFAQLDMIEKALEPQPSAPIRLSIPRAGWTINPPPGFSAIASQGRLHWRRDVLLPPTEGSAGGGDHFEYIMASAVTLPTNLVAGCTREAGERGLRGLKEERPRGRREATYVCPGHVYSEEQGSSDTWTFLLDVDGKTGVNVSFWSTWDKIEDPRRVNPDHAAGLRAFWAACGSLRRGTGEAKASTLPAWADEMMACHPEGYEARVQKLLTDTRSFEVFYVRRTGSGFSRVSLSSDAKLRLGDRAATIAELRLADWVRVQPDCMTGLATEVSILRAPDGTPGGPTVRAERLDAADRKAFEAELRRAGGGPWDACSRLDMIQRCVIASR